MIIDFLRLISCSVKVMLERLYVDERTWTAPQRRKYEWEALDLNPWSLRLGGLSV